MLFGAPIYHPNVQVVLILQILEVRRILRTHFLREHTQGPRAFETLSSHWEQATTNRNCTTTRVGEREGMQNTGGGGHSGGQAAPEGSAGRVRTSNAPKYLSSLHDFRNAASLRGKKRIMWTHNIIAF